MLIYWHAYLLGHLTSRCRILVPFSWRINLIELLRTNMRTFDLNKINFWLFRQKLNSLMANSRHTKAFARRRAYRPTKNKNRINFDYRVTASCYSRPTYNNVSQKFEAKIMQSNDCELCVWGKFIKFGACFIENCYESSCTADEGNVHSLVEWGHNIDKYSGRSYKHFLNFELQLIFGIVLLAPVKMSRTFTSRVWSEHENLTERSLA